MNILGYSGARLIWLFHIISIPKFGHFFVQHIHATLVFEFCRGAKTNETHLTNRWSFQERDRTVAKWRHKCQDSWTAVANCKMTFVSCRKSHSVPKAVGLEGTSTRWGTPAGSVFSRLRLDAAMHVRWLRGWRWWVRIPPFEQFFHMKMMKQSTTTF